ncbi:MAG: hypothetical protein HIU91_05000 [Acidobacteria bacterium]|nr:hypothetical protein [Acidobacteriota bacterium]
MRNRYQTGPFIALLFFVVVLGMIVFDIFNAMHLHHRIGWINAVVALSILFFFDRRYRCSTE